MLSIYFSPNIHMVGRVTVASLIVECSLPATSLLTLGSQPTVDSILLHSIPIIEYLNSLITFRHNSILNQPRVNTTSPAIHSVTFSPR